MGAPESLHDCVSNLRNIHTALEMYSTDYDGAHPGTLGILTPDYLLALPTCPAQESKVEPYLYLKTVRSLDGHDSPGGASTFRLVCKGENHRDVQPSNYPQYDEVQHLIER